MTEELTELFAGDLVFNGVDGESGEYLLPEMPSEDLARLLTGRGSEDDRRLVLGAEPATEMTEAEVHQEKEAETVRIQELGFKEALAGPMKAAPVKEGVDPMRLDRAGWAVVFPEGMDAGRRNSIKEALDPLLSLRSEQAGDLFRIYEGEDGYRSGERKDRFFRRQTPEIREGPADPMQMPFYVLLVGSPEEIPFEFQFQLDVMRGVGRLDFGDDLEAYSAYARSVVEAEEGQRELPPWAAFWGPDNPNDRATQLSAKWLIKPLVDNLRQIDIKDEISLKQEWGIKTFVGDGEATKEQLAKLLGDDPNRMPTLLFTASHGTGFRRGRPLQRTHQGALLCQEWQGPGTPISPDSYFAGEDLASSANLLGRMAVLFACYGAGTPKWDHFAKQTFKARAQIADEAFLAALPQRLLAQGMLATIGHVDRAWGYSFIAPGGNLDNQAFITLLRKLMNGDRVGLATDPSFNLRYAAKATNLNGALEEEEWTPGSTSPHDLVYLWTSNNDARNYVVLGDPAVQLRVAEIHAGQRPADRETVTLPSEPISKGLEVEAPPLGFDGDFQVEVGDQEIRPTAKAEPRYTNVDLVDEARERWDDANPLKPDTQYHLRLDIGALRQESVIKNATEFPFPDELLPETAEGHWLDVVAVSDEFRVEPVPHRLFLPRNQGGSWVCTCARGKEHTCGSDEREHFLYIAVGSPAEGGRASMRIGIYYENNLVQSMRFVAQIGEARTGEPGYESEIDYTLTQTLANVERLPARTLSIFTNDNDDGSHRVILLGEDDEEEGDKFVHYQQLRNPQTLKTLLDRARKELHDRHRVKKKSFTGEQWVNLLDENNAKDKEALIADLKSLAKVGRALYTKLFQRSEDRRKLRNRLANRGVIQTGRPRSGHAPTYFPWSLIYDIPLDRDLPNDSDAWHVCDLVTEWRAGEQLVDPAAGRCPHADQHRRNTICPFGFWGFKHVLEHQPSWPGDVPLRIALSDGRPNLVAGFHHAFTEWEDHVSALKPKVEVAIKDKSKAEILQAMLATGLEFIYFFCHGEWQEWPAGTNLWEPYILVGDGERITTDDLIEWQDELLGDGWRSTHPLVFINGCHTAEVAPDVLDNFVNRFVDANAGGVIGTEVTISPRLASEAAGRLFAHLLEDTGNVGMAIRGMRCDLLAKGNVMGLAYTPYCSAELHLEPK